ncbi:MAG: hypothetical protein PHU08_05170, partial [Dehalococcoidales bacterium]|nr:hypothetical protein [Dehalococcoidales bacterium]
MREKPKFFYGYWILAAAFVCLVVSVGSVWWTFSLFIKPIEADLSWSRGTIMVAFSIFTLVAGVTAPFIGRLIDQYGAR